MKLHRKKDQIINNENNTKIIELTDEIEKIKKEKESLEEQKKELEEKNNKLSEENIKLTTKLKTLKESILKLKECLEKDIYIKLESKTKLLKETLLQKDLLTKQNKSLTEEIKKFKLVEEEFQIYRDKFNSLLKEKSNKDNLSLKQEEKLKSFEKEIDILNKECQNKDEKYKKLDEIYLSVIKVIEEHKKTIYNLKNKIKIKEADENNKIILDEKHNPKYKAQILSNSNFDINTKKKMLEFAAFKVKEVESLGLEVLNENITFNEEEILNVNKNLFIKLSRLEDIEYDVFDESKKPKGCKDVAIPGKPLVVRL